MLGNTMEQMRRNLVELTARAAPQRGRGEGRARRHRRRRLCRRRASGASRFVNPQAERLLKVSAAEVDRRVLRRRAEAAARRARPPAVRALVPDPRKRAAAAPARAVEQVVPFSADSPRRVVIASAPPAADGMQVQVLRDETELEAVRRTRDTVLANISHEFRTPLAAQLASIELLRDGVGTMNVDGAARARGVAAARHAAADVAHRQPARERAHRGGPARDSPSGRGVRRRRSSRRASSSSR